MLVTLSFRFFGNTEGSDLESSGIVQDKTYEPEPDVGTDDSADRIMPSSRAERNKKTHQ